MDVVTVDVNDIRVCLPLDELAIGPVLDDSHLSVNETGGGTVTATLRVVDLRRKFGFAPVTGNQGTRLLTMNTSDGEIALVIDRFATVKLLRDVTSKPFENGNDTIVVGVLADEGEPAFLLDWEQVLSTDTVLDINALFSVPVVTQAGSSETDFLEAIAGATGAEDGSISLDHVRQTAKTFGLPLSVANRLVTFHFSRTR